MKNILLGLLLAVLSIGSSIAENSFSCKVDGFSTTSTDNNFNTKNKQRRFNVYIESTSIRVVHLFDSRESVRIYPIVERDNSVIKALLYKNQGMYIEAISLAILPINQNYRASYAFIRPNVVNGWELICHKNENYEKGIRDSAYTSTELL